MNIQPGNSVRRRVSKQTKAVSDGVSEICSLVALVGMTAMIAAMFLAFFYAYVSLGNRIGAAMGEAKKIKAEIAKEEREAIGLRGLEAERSSHDYIMAQVKRFNLPLAPAKYHQTRRLTVLSVEQAAQMPLRVARYQTARTGNRRQLRNRR